MTDHTDLIARLPTIIRDCRALEASHGSRGPTFVSDTMGSAATALEALARESAELRGAESDLPPLFAAKFADGSLWIKVDDFSRIQAFYRAKIAALLLKDEERDHDKIKCFHCSKRVPVENTQPAGEESICDECYAEWKAQSDQCSHQWRDETNEFNELGRACDKCGRFELLEETPAVPDGGNDG